MRNLLRITAILLLSLLASQSWAQGNSQKGKGNAKAKSMSGQQADHGSSTSVEVTFGQGERDIIRNYLQDHTVDYAFLPPGIERRVARGKPLPPSIAKKNLPQDLESQLPQRLGYERLIVGNDIVLRDVAAGLVVDIMLDVFP